MTSTNDAVEVSIWFYGLIWFHILFLADSDRHIAAGPANSEHTKLQIRQLIALRQTV